MIQNSQICIMYTVCFNEFNVNCAQKSNLNTSVIKYNEKKTIQAQYFNDHILQYVLRRVHRVSLY